MVWKLKYPKDLKGRFILYRLRVKNEKNILYFWNS